MHFCFQFCAFVGFGCVHVCFCDTLCFLYFFIVSFLLFVCFFVVSSFIVFVLSYLNLFYYYFWMPICILTRAREKERV